MKPDFLFRRPLFYAALFFCCLIILSRVISPDVYHAVPKNDISRFIQSPSEKAVIQGVIVSEPQERENAYHEKYVSFIIQCTNVRPLGGEALPVGGRLKATIKTPQMVFEDGDTVKLSGEISLPKGPRNPGNFDYREYLDRQGIYSLFYCGKKAEQEILSRKNGNALLKSFSRIRRYMSQKLGEGFGEEDAAFLKALLLGERNDISADFQDLFVRTGTMHILAVSGFNVGFLSAAILFLLAPLPLPKNIRLILVLTLIWIYCLIIGWQAPLVRASVMATVFIFGRLLGRKADLLNSLGLAAILILLSNPKNLYDIGFQLSFLAVAGLALFMPLFTEKPQLLPNEHLGLRRKISLYGEELFWVSFVATLVTLPITVQNFYIVTPSSLLANMIVVPLSFALFFCGIIYFLTFWWVPAAVSFIPQAMKLMMQIFTRSLTWIADWPYSCITVGRLCPVLEMLLIIGTLYILWDKKIISRYFRAVILILFGLNVFLAQEILHHFKHRFTMTVLDVGQGDAIYFEFPEGGNLLMDAGKGDGSSQGSRTVVPYLKSMGVRTIDALVISHPQADHIGGMSAVLKEMHVVNVFDAKKNYESRLYGKLKHEIAAERAFYWKAGRGDRIDGFRGVEVQVLNPPADEAASKNINNDSLVLKIIYLNTSFLLPGDIEDAGMKGILDSGIDLKSDVLKVPHHGAKLVNNGVRFVRAAAPSISVISVGERNQFRHPRPETLRTLTAIPGNHIFRTDQLGAVTLSSDGNRIFPVSS